MFTTHNIISALTVYFQVLVLCKQNILHFTSKVMLKETKVIQVHTDIMRLTLLSPHFLVHQRCIIPFPIEKQQQRKIWNILRKKEFKNWFIFWLGRWKQIYPYSFSTPDSGTSSVLITAVSRSPILTSASPSLHNRNRCSELQLFSQSGPSFFTNHPSAHLVLQTCQSPCHHKFTLFVKNYFHFLSGRNVW